ncbi:MAG: dTDP-4-dehydrorhamnose reductase [Desulfobacteraceae bacterium]|nr:dTDP-4-dehydrorhamnose reductase [Desulfobacteraceae bacterium]
MKILITGSRGQLGHDVVNVLEADHHLLSLDLPELDITDFKSLKNVIGEFRPDVVINCAAYTQVDTCETQKELAHAVNAIGPDNLSRCLADHGGRFIHISTDYVFNGKKPIPEIYIEKDPTHPVSVYGETKLSGEQSIQQNLNNYVILRTSWLYGINGGNFLKTILRLSMKDSNPVIRVVDDQYGSPTWSYRLAKQIAAILDSDANGIYHATAEGYCTWFELAKAFLSQMGINKEIVACTTPEYPTAAKRPMNSILENFRLKSEKTNEMIDWKQDLNKFVSLHRDQLIKEAVQ